nr:reverse transcriptase domain-containing protein [Tanacetum cinerariifolium]
MLENNREQVRSSSIMSQGSRCQSEYELFYPTISSEVSELKDIVRALLLDKKNQSSVLTLSSTPAPVKAIEPNCVTCGGTHSYQNFLRNMQSQGQGVQNQCQGLQTQIANLTDMLSKFVSSNTASSLGSRTLPSNTITNPKEDLKDITTRSGFAYQGPPITTPSKVVKQGTEVTKDQVKTPSSQSTAPVQPPVIQSETQTSVSEPVVAPVSVLIPNLKPPILYPSRRDNERRSDQANEQIEKFYKIFKEMSFEELKVCEAKTVKSSVDEPHEVELKDLPPQLEYAFLEGDNNLPVIFAKELGDDEKSALIKVLKSHK